MVFKSTVTYRTAKATMAIISMTMVFLLIQCIDPYQSPDSQVDLKYLVVEAFLNGSDSTCSVILSRTATLDPRAEPQPETAARVFLQSDVEPQQTLQELGKGIYRGSKLKW